jgi:hypothetical protein
MKLIKNIMYAFQQHIYYKKRGEPLSNPTKGGNLVYVGFQMGFGVKMGLLL